MDIPAMPGYIDGMRERQNILLITSDQHRADSLGCYGHPCVRTPHLDILAEEGMMFTNAYSDCPVCIPARTTLVTGIQSHLYGKPEYCPSFRISRPREKFLGSIIGSAGYGNAVVGKTHWHADPDFDAGFNEWISYRTLERLQERLGYGMKTGIGRNEMIPMLDPLPPELCSTNWTVQKSIEFLEKHDHSRPFFLWTSMVHPHPENIIHEPYYSMYDDEDVPEAVIPRWSCSEETTPYAIRKIRYANSHSYMKDREARKARGVYYGMITNVDHQIGRLMGALMKHDFWDNTVIIYTTDHGEHLGDYGTYFKGTMLESSARIPLIIRCPTTMKPHRGETCDSLVELADLLPTFCDIARTPAPDDVTGKSLLPLLDDHVKTVRDELHGQIDNQHMFHDGRYKYLYFADDGAELIFDKSCDPFDEHNLVGDKELEARLRQSFIRHLESESHPHLKDGKLLNLGRKIMDHDRFNISGWLGFKGAG